MLRWATVVSGERLHDSARQWASAARSVVAPPSRVGSTSTTVDAAPIDTSIEPRDGDAQPRDVLALLRARIAGRGGDGRRLGLAVEGGGMRGIVSGAMLLALREFGAVGAFDACYGTSSGAVNLAYLFGGAGWEAMTVYYDYLTDGFLRRDRWNLTRPLLDMHYAFDQVIATTMPVGWEAVAEAGAPINAVLTDVDHVRSQIVDLRGVAGDGVAGQPVAHDRFAGDGGAGDGVAGDGVVYLKAACWLPVLAGSPPVVDGTRYLDGGVLCPDPVYAAIADGCTDVVVLNTSPQGVQPASPHSRPMLRPILDRWQPGLGEAYLRTRERWDADCADLRYDRDTAMDGCAVMRVAAAPASHRVERLTMRRDLLLDGARAGYRAVADLFGRSTVPYFALTSR